MNALDMEEDRLAGCRYSIKDRKGPGKIGSNERPNAEAYIWTVGGLCSGYDCYSDLREGEGESCFGRLERGGASEESQNTAYSS